MSRPVSACTAQTRLSRARLTRARQAAYKYSRELKGFDKDVAGHKGALTQDVVNRASQGVVLYIDVSLRKLFEP